MTQIRMEDSSAERTQRIYARVAGFLFLWLIISGLAIAVITGVAAGFFPAMRAANLPPIDALRSE